jgi:hypothetical protein
MGDERPHGDGPAEAPAGGAGEEGSRVSWGWVLCLVALLVAYACGRGLLEARAQAGWETAPARVTGVDVRRLRDDVPSEPTTPWEITVRYRFEAAGRSYGGVHVRTADAFGYPEEAAARWKRLRDRDPGEDGEPLVARYDPADPGRNALGAPRSSAGHAWGLAISLLAAAGAVVWAARSG